MAKIQFPTKNPKAPLTLFDLSHDKIQIWVCVFQLYLFFLQHGKDFEAIQNNIALKYKKKGKPASMVKNKEQVRHFYYRTWHKISKYIDFDNG